MEGFELAEISDDEWDSMTLGQKLAKLDPEVVREVFFEALKKTEKENPLLSLLGRD